MEKNPTARIGITNRTGWNARVRLLVRIWAMLMSHGLDRFHEVTLKLHQYSLVFVAVDILHGTYILVYVQ